MEDVWQAETRALQLEAAYCSEEGFMQQLQSVAGQVKMEENHVLLRQMKWTMMELLILELTLWTEWAQR